MNILEKKEKIINCINEIARILTKKQVALSNRMLLEICNDFKILSGENDPHVCHEIAECALNWLIKEEKAQRLLASKNPTKLCEEEIRHLLGLLPTQTWRSETQIRLQQFSTPPTIGYLTAYLMNFKAGEKILEPSAGTGSLAAWVGGVNLPLAIHTNEIDQRRRDLLRALGFSPTGYDAEFIHDCLPPETEIDVVMMNPPFSSSGGRTANNSSKFGFRHVASAFERLKRGGRFGVILGDAAAPDAKAGNDFWKILADRISLKAVIKIPGREYYKNGTSVCVNLFLGEKLTETRAVNWNDMQREIAVIAARTIEEAFTAADNLNLRFIQ